MPGRHFRITASLGLALILSGASAALAQTVGASASFAVSASAGVTAAGGVVVNGDVGASPTASITGFPPAVVLPPFGLHPNDAAAMAAHSANLSLYAQLSAGSCSDNPVSTMDGVAFGPGIHCFASTAVLGAGGNMILSGTGIYIFRVGSALTAAAGSTVTTLAGANPCNVYWQVTSAATIDGDSFVGNVVAQAGVTMAGGASLTGRALATGASVTLAANVTVGGCSVPVPPPCSAITLAPTTLAGATVGTLFSQTITGSGGASPYAFGVTTGGLPAGLALDTAGVLSGTPSAAGSSSFTVSATDANGCSGTRAYTIVTAAAPPPVCGTITLTPTTLPGATVGVGFNQTFTGSGGASPYVFGVTTGGLPAGLALDTAGVLSG
ncbi:MAG: ice-binding family protein, partial [Vicinamibacterales bacterium]